MISPKLFFQESIQNSLKVANTLSEDADSTEQAAVDFLLEGPLDKKIVDMNELRFLPEAVNSSYSLLNDHWIPGKVIVDHRVAELHVQTFTTNFGREKNVDVRIYPETLDDTKTVFHGTIDEHGLIPFLGKPILEVLQGLNLAGKNNELFMLLLDYLSNDVLQLIVLRISREVLHRSPGRCISGYTTRKELLLASNCKGVSLRNVFRKVMLAAIILQVLNLSLDFCRSQLNRNGPSVSNSLTPVRCDISLCRPGQDIVEEADGGKIVLNAYSIGVCLFLCLQISDDSLEQGIVLVVIRNSFRDVLISPFFCTLVYVTQLRIL